MASVVFLRGANVGGHRTFRPGALARQMAALGVVNIGAAGTFVVRQSIGQAALRAQFLEQLPFEAELMICPGREILSLGRSEAFPEPPGDAPVTQYVTIMAKRPAAVPALPITQPAGDAWQVKVLRVTGRFALSWNRRTGKTLVYPNEVVEKKLGVSATTRNWNTIAALCEILEQS